jgi:hypothetical protein
MPGPIGVGRQQVSKNTNIQPSSSREAPNSNFEATRRSYGGFGAWILDLLWSLVFGAWNFSCPWSLELLWMLEVGAWSLARASVTYDRNPLEPPADSLSRSRNDAPRCRKRSSSRRVQSQSQQAQGSEPFQSRQFLRLCASLMLTSSKYSSQYGRSSCRGVAQKHVSTQCASPPSETRAFSMSLRYSSPAIEPWPSVPSEIARSSDFSFPALTRALTR